ncbi:MAG TPA: sigma-70 family RNA polymerase sigma factor [Leptospiraceae bacterium]|nr:sigma-70 family RNA polymerase sigma factor [Leptospiraceae bacterium]HMW06661.1 sigma-70 family RNA polymerase sigma factor [Leptospiraceae bacterium]HMX34657.1 sigma-70 family RNA polymerase sigma factor [Leptospiraceae bacterium]HMY33712.1 sigma-70 family RNA polymerase sigma factor [Leptospiraceae bacterium]HMZ66193.1 sigma-70 family RNA polymerase sigma factor [Leptospiraceae bacterium]
MHTHADHLTNELLKYRKELIGFIIKRTQDPDLAEDIFQDSLLKLVRKSPDIEDTQSLLAWFYTLLRNAIIDTYRKKNTDAKKLESIKKSFQTEINSTDKNDLCECFKEILPILNPDYKEIIEADLREEDTDTTAKRLGIEKNNLKVKKFRARKQLKERLEQTCRMCAKHGCLDCTCKKDSSHSN